MRIVTIGLVNWEDRWIGECVCDDTFHIFSINASWLLTALFVIAWRETGTNLYIFAQLGIKSSLDIHLLKERVEQDTIFILVIYREIVGYHICTAGDSCVGTIVESIAEYSVLPIGIAIVAGITEFCEFWIFTDSTVVGTCLNNHVKIVFSIKYVYTGLCLTYTNLG